MISNWLIPPSIYNTYVLHVAKNIFIMTYQSTIFNYSLHELADFAWL